jgi:hypothetical protein
MREKESSLIFDVSGANEMAFFDLTHRRRVYYKFLFAAFCFFLFGFILLASISFLRNSLPFHTWPHVNLSSTQPSQRNHFWINYQCDLNAA